MPEYAVPVTLYHEGEYIVEANSAKEAEEIVRHPSHDNAQAMETFADHGVRKVTVRGHARLFE